MDHIETPAIRYLQDRNVPHDVFIHAGPVHSLEQAALERNQRPEQVVRSIVFRLAEGEFLMVLMPGPGQIPWKALRRYIGQSRITMANEEELLAATGYRPGTVTPFGLPGPMRILVDQGVIDQAQISLGSGKPGIAIMMDSKHLLGALDNFEVVHFSDDSQS